jgi:hypothetical protein
MLYAQQKCSRSHYISNFHSYLIFIIIMYLWKMSIHNLNYGQHMLCNLPTVGFF